MTYPAVVGNIVCTLLHSVRFCESVVTFWKHLKTLKHFISDQHFLSPLATYVLLPQHVRFSF